MLEQYRALSKAVQRPMQRWWKRTGVWWVCAIVMLALADAVIRGLLVSHLEQQSQLASAAGGGVRFATMWGIPSWEWFYFACLIGAAARALVIYAWLLAGMHAMRQAAAIIRDIPYPAPDAPRRLYFLLALQAGWPLAVLWLAISGSASPKLFFLLSGSDQIHSVFNVLNVQFSQIPGEPWASFTGVVLILALAVVIGAKETPVWLWVAAFTWTPVVVWLYDLMGGLITVQTFGVTPLRLAGANLPRLDWGLGWVAGAVLTIAVLRLYACGKRAWGHVVLSVMLVSLILCGFGESIPLLPVRQGHVRHQTIEASSAVGITLGLVRSFGDFPCSALADYQLFQHAYSDKIAAQSVQAAGADGALRFYAPVRTFIIAPALVGYLVAPINLLYLALLVTALTYAGLNSAAPKSRRRRIQKAL
jgi:hypothetical protein